MDRKRILHHIEQTLGPVSKGWKEGTKNQTIDVVLILNAPAEGLQTYCTIGLSEQKFMLSDKKSSVRLEIFLGCHQMDANEDLVWLLFHIANKLKSSNTALERGEVLNIGSSIFPKSSFSKLYVAAPTIYPEDFWALTETKPETIFVWLIPIADAEAEFISQNGWEKFESLLETFEGDIFDIERNLVV